MADFLLIYDNDYGLKEGRPSPQQLQNSISEWKRWHQMLSIRSGKPRPLSSWARDGVTLHAEDPDPELCIEVRESSQGLVFLRARNYDEAVAFAGQCPILQLGGNIEVRKISLLEEST